MKLEKCCYSLAKILYQRNITYTQFYTDTAFFYITLPDYSVSGDNIQLLVIIFILPNLARNLNLAPVITFSKMLKLGRKWQRYSRLFVNIEW